jgi:hypothetical protein
MRKLATVVLLVCVHALAACGPNGSSASLFGPSAGVPSVAQPVGPTLRQFAEPGTGFSTTSLYDAHDHIVQFNTASELIWVADGTRIPGFPVVDRTYINAEKICACWFEVRFGTKDGERRAYLTADYGHYNPATLVGLELVGGTLVMTQSDLFPPGTFTLSGMVTEMTTAGLAPVERADVWFPLSSGYRETSTGTSGLYTIYGVAKGRYAVSVSKSGFAKQTAEVVVDGDTRFDVTLVRH